MALPKANNSAIKRRNSYEHLAPYLPSRKDEQFAVSYFKTGSDQESDIVKEGLAPDDLNEITVFFWKFEENKLTPEYAHHRIIIIAQ